MSKSKLECFFTFVDAEFGGPFLSRSSRKDFLLERTLEKVSQGIDFMAPSTERSYDRRDARYLGHFKKQVDKDTEREFSALK